MWTWPTCMQAPCISCTESHVPFPLLRSYQSISPGPRHMYPFRKRVVLTVRSCYHLARSPSWRTNPCRLSATAYSIYSQPSYILEAVPPSVTTGRAMPWWQGPTYCGRTIEGIRGRFIKLWPFHFLYYNIWPLRFRCVLKKIPPCFKKYIAIEMKWHKRNA